MSPDQEPKYEAVPNPDGPRLPGIIINRATQEPIPADEPVFIFRARDRHALNVLGHYASLVQDDQHLKAVVERMSDFAAFRVRHPDRMKEPDTAGSM